MYPTRLSALIIPLAVMLYAPVSLGSEPIQDGVIQITSELPEEGLRLNGNWKFHWGSFLNVKQVARNPDKTMLQMGSHLVPSRWEVPGPDGSTLPAPLHGKSTYMLKLEFINGRHDKLSMIFPEVASAYELWLIDNHHEKFLGGGGRISKAGQPMVHHHQSQLFTLDTPKNGELFLVVHVEKRKGGSGGVVSSPVVNTPHRTRVKWDSLALRSYFIMGLLVIAGLFHALLFWFRRSDQSNLYFSILCYLIVTRTWVADWHVQRFFESPPEWYFELRVRTVVLTYFASVCVAFAFLQSFFPKIIPKKRVKQLLMISAPFFFLAFHPSLTGILRVLPIYHLITLIGCLYFAVSLIRLSKRGDFEARICLIGFSILVYGALNDILSAMLIIEAEEIVPWTLSFFVMTNSYLVARRFGNAIDTSERLTENLQEEVEQQTKELRLRTQEAEKSRSAADQAHKAIANLNQHITENILKRYLSPELVDEIISGKRPVNNKPVSMDVTILFTDLVNFTPMAEKHGTETIVMMLNEYFTKMTDIIFANGGTIDKFIGDAIMVMFGAPVSSTPKTQVEQAVQCARQMQAVVKQLNRDWKAQGLPEFEMRLGIHQGPAVVGNLGSDKRSDYTAIGTTVNIASRIESICPANEIFVSSSVASRLGPEEAIPLGPMRLKGIQDPVEIFRIARPKVVPLNSEIAIINTSKSK